MDTVFRTASQGKYKVTLNLCLSLSIHLCMAWLHIETTVLRVVHKSVEDPCGNNKIIKDKDT